MQDQKQQNPRPFKVGDRVVSKRFGEGVVIDANGKNVIPYPIACRFARGEYFFTKEGLFIQGGMIEDPCNIQHAEPLMNELDDIVIQREDGQVFGAYCSGVVFDESGTYIYEIICNEITYVCASTLSFTDKDGYECKVVEITQK